MERYHFETYSGKLDSFDHDFTTFVNKKYDDGWKYKDCQFSNQGDWRFAYCLFKKV